MTALGFPVATPTTYEPWGCSQGSQRCFWCKCINDHQCISMSFSCTPMCSWLHLIGWSCFFIQTNSRFSVQMVSSPYESLWIRIIIQTWKTPLKPTVFHILHSNPSISQMKISASIQHDPAIIPPAARHWHGWWARTPRCQPSRLDPASPADPLLPTVKSTRNLVATYGQQWAQLWMSGLWLSRFFRDGEPRWKGVPNRERKESTTQEMHPKLQKGKGSILKIAVGNLIL